jgi:hypothetical protein
VPAYAKVSLEKLRCNNAPPPPRPPPQQFCGNLFAPYHLQQPAWIFSHPDDEQPYSVPNQQPLVAKMKSKPWYRFYDLSISPRKFGDKYLSHSSGHFRSQYSYGF